LFGEQSEIIIVRFIKTYKGVDAAMGTEAVVLVGKGEEVQGRTGGRVKGGSQTAGQPAVNIG